MEADLDSDWLSGKSSWWQRAEGRPESERVSIEIEPNEHWNGWKRQRLKPMAARFVLAPSWSLALLIASTFPLIFPGKTPDDQMVSSILFFSSFVVLMIQPIRIASAMPDGDGLTMLCWLWFGDGFSNYSRSIGFTLLGAISFVGHILIDVRIGWLSYLCFLILWFHLTFRAATALMPPSGRWLVPIGDLQFDGSQVSDSWELERKRFFRNRLAKFNLTHGQRVELHGVKRRGEKFIALHLRHPSSIIYDPFVDVARIGSINFFGLGFCGARLEGVEGVLEEPPINLTPSSWPEEYLCQNEEE